MSVVTIVWALVAGACFTLAASYGPVLWRNRSERAILAFALAAFCTGVAALFELAMLKTTTPAAHAGLQRWLYVPLTLVFVTLVAFLHLHLRTGRLWLGLAGIGLRLAAAPFNFIDADNLRFTEVVALRDGALFGERVAIPVGATNPWLLMNHAAVLLMIAFAVDAALGAWRRREATWTAGAAIALFLVTGVSQSALVAWAGLQIPLMSTVLALGIVAVMAHAMGRDMAQAKEQSLALREREQEAELTAEAAHLGTWTRELAHDGLACSPHWRALFGFERGEPVSTRRLLDRIHPEDRPGFLERMTEHAAYHAEFRVQLPDGSLRWMANEGRVESDLRGKPLRIRGVSIDVTPRKMADQEMGRLRQEIAHVGRVAVMGQLASTLAHEINQPLSAILRNAEAAALFMQHPDPDLAEIAAIVEDIRKDDERAGAVIDRMRALLRRGEVAHSTLDVGQMLADVATLLRPDATARHVKLELEVAAGTRHVRGDRVQLQQVLLNLILNGMDALDGLDVPDHLVRVSAVETDGGRSLEICVRDTGCGIPAERLEQIFDPFYSTKPKGIGMGLSISRDIVEAHGGRLWAENHPDGGARFCFTLPMTKTR